MLIIFITLSACTQGSITSDPMGQLEVYGIQKITKQQLTKKLLETICVEAECQVFLSDGYPNGGKKDIGRIKFENGSSFIFDFLPDGTTGFLYVQENVKSNDEKPIEFIQRIEQIFGATLFFNVKTWNCYPAKDSCGTKERKLTVPVPFVDALVEAKQIRGTELGPGHLRLHPTPGTSTGPGQLYGGIGDGQALGITVYAREKMDISMVDQCSSSYTAGSWAATIAVLPRGWPLEQSKAPQHLENIVGAHNVLKSKVKGLDAHHVRQSAFSYHARCI